MNSHIRGGLTLGGWVRWGGGGGGGVGVRGEVRFREAVVGKND